MLSGLQIPPLSRSQVIVTCQCPAWNRAVMQCSSQARPCKPTHLCGPKLPSPASSEFSALRECHHLSNLLCRWEEGEGWGAAARAAVPLEGDFGSKRKICRCQIDLVGGVQSCHCCLVRWHPGRYSFSPDVIPQLRDVQTKNTRMWSQPLSQLNIWQGNKFPTDQSVL